MSSNKFFSATRRSLLKNTSLATAGTFFPFIHSAKAQSLTPITMAIQWVPRGEYATYYMAREKGYYKESGLDVTFKHMLGNALAFQALSAGNADIVHADILQMLMLIVFTLNLHSDLQLSSVW